MYKGKKIIVITPAYNEANHIAKVINGLPDYIDNIVIVNDASTDNTEQVIMANMNPRVIYLKNEKNCGYGGSVTRAVNKAIELGADIAVKMDGDNQMDPKYLPDLLDPICEHGYDYTKGNRFFSKEGLKGMPKHRVLGSIILTFMTRLASGYWRMFDAQNGYYAIGPRALNEIDFDSLSQGWSYGNDLLINLNILGMKIKGIPIPAVYGDEVSHMRMWKVIPNLGTFLFLGFFRRFYRKYVLRGIHPIALFFFSGLTLLTWGIGFGLLAWHHSSATGVPATTGTVMLAAIPLLMGFEMLLWSLVLDIQEDPSR